MQYNNIYKFIRLVALGALMLVGVQNSNAISYRITVDTSALAADPSGSYSLDFQLIGGDPLANSVKLSNFMYAGGFPTYDPAPTLIGGASGELDTFVTLSTTEFFNEFYQGFVPGSFLSFDIEFLSNVNEPTPDAFSFAILDKDLFNIPTNGLGNSLVLINFDSSDPVIQTFTAANGVTASVGPVPPQGSAVPDSGTTVSLLGLALAGVLALHHLVGTRRLTVA